MNPSVYPNRNATIIAPQPVYAYSYPNNLDLGYPYSPHYPVYYQEDPCYQSRHCEPQSCDQHYSKNNCHEHDCHDRVCWCDLL